MAFGTRGSRTYALLLLNWLPHNASLRSWVCVAGGLTLILPLPFVCAVAHLDASLRWHDGGGCEVPVFTGTTVGM